VVTDPSHPLFGRRFEVHSYTAGDAHSARVYVVFRGDHRLMILREATNLSVLERTAPRGPCEYAQIARMCAIQNEPMPRNRMTTKTG
jgi:hypothetical protein